MKLLIIFILLGFIICCASFIKSNKSLEKFTNLIDNGSFEKGKYSKNNVGSNIGNNIIKKINPGKTSYVLRQSANINGKIKKTRYQMSLDIIPGAEYIISSWVLYADNWDGNNNIFNLTLHRNCGDSELIINEGLKTKEEIINKEMWIKKEFIFTVPNNSNGKIDIYIGYDPQNNKGYRYITDINLQRHYPLIKDLPIQDNLILYVSGDKKQSFENNNTIWNDLSMNGRDIKFNDRVSLNNKQLEIRKLKGTGSESNLIVPNQNKFAFVWSCSMKSFTEGTFLEIFANNKSNIGIKIYFKNKVGINNIMVLSIGSKEYIFKIGLSQKKNTYILTKNSKEVKLYIDGYEFIPDKTIGTIMSDLEISNKNIEINPNKKLDFDIDYLLIYSDYLQKDKILLLNSYIETNRVLKTNQFCRPDLNNRNCSCSINNPKDSSIINHENIINNSIKADIKITDTISQKKCPFSVKCNESPCTTLECQGSDWSNFEVSDKCKQVINNYCKKNKDNICNQLREKKKKNDLEYKSCSSSKEIISNLKNKLNSNGNNEVMYKNSKELNNQSKKCPDMTKYIRKDKIPCWGCKIK